MSNWTLMFLCLALAAAIFGFTPLAGVATAGISQILFYIFVMLLAASAVGRVFHGQGRQH